MYVVMTLEELWLNCGLSMDVCDTFWWDIRSLEEEHCGIPWEELKKYEVCMCDGVARRLGLVRPRGEEWIDRFLTLPGDRGYSWAQAPKRKLPSRGDKYEPRFVDEAGSSTPDRDAQT